MLLWSAAPHAGHAVPLFEGFSDMKACPSALVSNNHSFAVSISSRSWQEKLLLWLVVATVSATPCTVELLRRAHEGCDAQAGEPEKVSDFCGET